jgi:hypothetical protein
MKRGMLEVTTSEKNTIGTLEPLPEVSINCSAGHGVSSRENGSALITASNFSNNTDLYLSKTGYGNIDNCNVPINQNYLTIVSAEMARNGSIPDCEATISWIKPYSYQSEVAVMNPFIIGFSQAMEKSSAFDSISLMVNNKNTNELIPITSKEIKELFNIVWDNNTVVYLYPKNGYKANTRYSILVNNWTAKTIDGRYLKNYVGTYYEFKTDEDPEPKVLAFEPVNGATNVSRNGPFIVYFDRSIDPDSLYEDTMLEVVCVNSNSSIKLSGSSIRSFFNIIWRNNNTELQLIPYKTLDPRNTYQIRLNKCSFKSASGKAISGLENFWTSFTTGGI